jgi:3-oxoacyl-[acyl-carrier-protein] synthase II
MLALAAADSAIAMAGLNPAIGRWALVVGTGYGAGPFLEAQVAAFQREGLSGVSPLAVPLSMPNSVASAVARFFGIRGPVLTTCAACASGTVAIGEALHLLRADRADVVLVGGVDAVTHALAAVGFARLATLADWATYRPPFHKDRRGFVLSEGAAFLVMTREDDVSGETAFGKVLGYASNDDCHHLVAPLSSGIWAANCMRDAILDSGLSARDVGHVNSHGTATRANDAAEAAAIGQVFGSLYPPVTATKSATGHMIGASGVAEAIAAILACRRGSVPPVVGLDEPDPALDLNLVTNDARSVGSSIAISASYAFGGTNAALVLGSV